MIYKRSRQHNKDITATHVSFIINVCKIFLTFYGTKIFYPDNNSMRSVVRDVLMKGF